MLAPDRPTLYVAMPRDDLTEQLAPFAPLADLAGTDYYPVGAPGSLSETEEVARTTRNLAVKHGSGPVMVLQSFSWSQYGARADAPFPTRRQMRRMRDAAIRHGSPSMLLWYSFNDVFRYRHPRAHWRDLRRAAFSPYSPKAEPHGARRGSRKPRSGARARGAS